LTLGFAPQLPAPGLAERRPRGSARTARGLDQSERGVDGSQLVEGELRDPFAEPALVDSALLLDQSQRLLTLDLDFRAQCRGPCRGRQHLEVVGPDEDGVPRALAVRGRELPGGAETVDVATHAATPCRATHCYTAATITFRPDKQSRLVLEELTAVSTPVSAAVRCALVEAAARHAKARLRAEVEALAANEDDRAEPGLTRSKTLPSVVTPTPSGLAGVDVRRLRRLAPQHRLVGSPPWPPGVEVIRRRGRVAGVLLATLATLIPQIAGSWLAGFTPVPMSSGAWDRGAVRMADLPGQPLSDGGAQPRSTTSFADFGRLAAMSAFHCATDAR
jgi:hypothetical protein